MPEVRDILKLMESQGNPNAIGDNGKSWGILQIQESVIKDVNRRYGTQYIHEDALEIGCAEEIFELYINMWVEQLEKRHNRKATIEDMIRIWNGGPRGYQHSSTDPYMKKYYIYKKKSTMNQKACIVRGKMGIIIATYTHTYDVYLFESKKRLNVGRKFVKLLPGKKEDETQLKLGL